MFLRQRRLAFTFLSFAAILFSGCVEANVRTFLRYDKADDSFHCLQTYDNLHATDKRELDHVESLWKRRAGVIPCPSLAFLLVGEFNIFGVESLERTAKNRIRQIDLGRPADKESEPKTTQVDLDAIQVIPGQFHLNSHGNLAYYQQCVVPGKTLDAILAEVTPLFAAELEQLAAKQIKLALKAKPMTWEAVRRSLLDDLEGKDKPKPPVQKDGKATGDPPLPLDAESLRLLGKAVADKSVKLGRLRDQFTMVVPLSKRDSQEAVATLEFLRKTVAERVKSGKLIDKDLPELLDSLKVRQVEGGLEATLDFTKYAKAETSAESQGPDGKKKAGYASTLAAIQAKGIPIAKAGAVEKLVKEYDGK